MRELFLFLFKFRAFFFFVFLEIISFLLIVHNNRYHGAAFFNSANQLAAGTMDLSSNISNYFGLKGVNEELSKENALLRELLQEREDSLMVSLESSVEDSLFKAQKYIFQPAKVINNSFRRSNNYLTISEGRGAGIEPGMGVVSSTGIVGKVKAVSKHYATITSLLHSNFSVSSLILSTNTYCSVIWDGNSPTKARLLYVPRHLPIAIGDTVVTSGFNAVFPEGTLIGTISNLDIQDNEAFYDIDLQLSTDFSSLPYVYVVKNNFKIEQDSLQVNSFTEQ
ncbi:rod shape-determining protein MreC [Xanthovirga aplysinae]|uniref:rod shape-determining protein MreC n=1 Tax=Xanthovirga aplysinae TaxID=2529853 RepID=UPI0012BCB773|nr:rod shape-determining protein MreC [Xanthovirga aplysinae]MTI33626.1 rod shape-determining protein MreC [Xanthovirga aplysinae]